MEVIACGRENWKAIEMEKEIRGNLLKKCFILCFWTKHNSYNVYLKNELIQNRFFQRRFLVKSSLL
jgi:hypothetical protein